MIVTRFIDHKEQVQDFVDGSVNLIMQTLCEQGGDKSHSYSDEEVKETLDPFAQHYRSLSNRRRAIRH